MSISVTSADVKAIIEVDASISLTPFIDVAIDLVTEVCTSATYTNTRLKRIAIWLSAFFYSIRDRRAISESAGGVSQSLQSVVGLGFNANEYGQMAMRLDTVGGLASLNESIMKGKRGVVSISWLGTEKVEIGIEEE